MQTTYDKFVAISEIFEKFSFGVTTARDHFVVGFTEHEIKQRMRTFTSNLPDDLVAQSLDLKDTSEWILKATRASIEKSDWTKYIKQYSYRPFDNRSICYSPALIERDRFEVMQHILDKDNLVLSLTRRLRDPIWQHVYITKHITDKTLLSSRDNCYCLPIYLYKKTEKSKKSYLKGAMMLFEPEAEYGVKKPNLSPAFFEKLTREYKKAPSPEEIFYYIYAVLYSSIYRTKYAEFLKIDFPRVPFTKDYKLFKKMGGYGEKLVELHLLKSSELDAPTAKFEGKGNDKVEKPRYEKGKLYINKDQYFEGISHEVWEYQIGGYQVCDKWLKDRKGRPLSLDDITHYCKVVTSLKKTIEVQSKIDSAYPEVEKEIIKF